MLRTAKHHRRTKMAKMIRKKKTPLPSWTDRVAAAHSFKRLPDIYIIEGEYEFRIVRWHCLVNMFGDLVDKVYVSIEAMPLRPIFKRGKRVVPKTLLESPFGLFCPKCLTNEFLASRNDFRTGSQKMINPGQYCLVCHREGRIE